MNEWTQIKNLFPIYVSCIYRWVTDLDNPQFNGLNYILEMEKLIKLFVFFLITASSVIEICVIIISPPLPLFSVVSVYWYW